MTLNTAVLFLIFNRPDTTLQVFNAIKKAKPPRLYISSDGPRLDQNEDLVKIEQARQIATAVDWPCEVKILFNDRHLGCRHAVTKGINWFFSHEEQGIILEDDCLPSQSFFIFCETMLKEYKNTENIMSISGTNIAGVCNKEASYLFSNYAIIWGWATWRRAWLKCDHGLTTWVDAKKSRKLEFDLGFSYLQRCYWERVLDLTANEKIDSWGYRWIYSCFINRGLTVTPSSNLIRNIGFSESATHTKGWHPILSCLVEKEIAFPYTRPPSLLVNEEFDNFVSRHWFEGSWIAYFKSSLGRSKAYKFLKLLNM